jgi:hypothetical protein
MLTFKQSEDLNKLSPDDPAYATVKELIEQLISAYTTHIHLRVTQLHVKILSGFMGVSQETSIKKFPPGAW